jgi:hypothetical protein
MFGLAVEHVDRVRRCLWTAAINRPVVYSPDNIWARWATVEWFWQRELEELGERPAHQCHFIHKKSHMYWPGLEPGSPCEKPMTHRLSHGQVWTWTSRMWSRSANDSAAGCGNKVGSTHTCNCNWLSPCSKAVRYKLTVAQLFKKFLVFVLELGGSLPCPQEPSTVPYPEPD